MPTPPLLDRFTAYSAIGGALTGAKDSPPRTALGVALALEVWETARQRAAHQPPPPNDFDRHAANVLAAMLAWFVARQATRRAG